MIWVKLGPECILGITSVWKLTIKTRSCGIQLWTFPYKAMRNEKYCKILYLIFLFVTSPCGKCSKTCDLRISFPVILLESFSRFYNISQSQSLFTLSALTCNTNIYSGTTLVTSLTHDQPSSWLTHASFLCRPKRFLFPIPLRCRVTCSEKPGMCHVKRTVIFPERIINGIDSKLKFNIHPPRNSLKHPRRPSHSHAHFLFI